MFQIELRTLGKSQPYILGVPLDATHYATLKWLSVVKIEQQRSLEAQLWLEQHSNDADVAAQIYIG